MLLVIGCKEASAFTFIDPSLGWDPVITFPFSMGAEVFYLPATGQIAIGSSVKVCQVQIPAIPHLFLEADGLIAKTFGTDQINQTATEDPLYGLGIKGSTDAFELSLSGNIKMFPSVGTGVLNNFKEVKNWNDLIDGFRWTIYGTLIQWNFK